jgi:hypothetical protein
MSEKKKSDLDKIRERRKGALQHEPADWLTADPTLVLRAIAAVARVGGALRFGYTRDGGAYAIGLYLSNDRTTEYVRPHEDINYYLEGLIEDIGEI